LPLTVGLDDGRASDLCLSALALTRCTGKPADAIIRPPSGGVRYRLVPDSTEAGPTASSFCRGKNNELMEEQ